MLERPTVDEFMRRGESRWDAEFAAHAEEQRRIERAIRGYGLGVLARGFDPLAGVDEED